MSGLSLTAEWRLVLDGTESLGFSYDEDADVLYLWRGERPRPAISLTNEHGHVIRLDEATGEIVGFTILNWRQVWVPSGTPLVIEVPDLEAERGRLSRATHQLELVPA